MPPLVLTEELIKQRDVITRQERQLHTLSQSYQAMNQNYEKMATTLREILECVGGRSAITSTPNATDVMNNSAGSSIRYSVYEQWQKNHRTNPKQVFVDWFLYDLPEGYQEDIRNRSLSGTTKSSFKRHKYVVECMLRCSSEYPPPLPETPQQRNEWGEKLKEMADAALQQMRETLHLNQDQKITQHTIVGNSDYRNKIMNERTLPQNTPLESIFNKEPTSKKRPRDNEGLVNV